MPPQDFPDDAATPPTREDFAAAIIQAISVVRPDLCVRFDREQFALMADGEQRCSNLASLYLEHCQLTEADRITHIRMLAAIFCDAGGDIPNHYEAARPQLLPRIWNRSMFEELELQRRIDGREVACNIPLYPLGEHLYSSLVYDLPTAMRSVSMEDLELWGVTVYQALEDACQNLQERPFTIGRAGSGFYTSMVEDNYDSARLLLISRQESFEIAGDLIAMVPRRDSLFFCGSEDVEALTMMLQCTGEVLRQEKRPLSPVPLRFRNGDWEDWQPSSDHPLFYQFAEIRNAFLGSLYASQKPLLQQLLDKDQQDVFVASYSGIRKKDSQEMLSYCVWGEGIDSLLPETDLVMLPTENTLAAMGYWSDVRKSAGALMQPVPGLYPRRFRVREFPSFAQLDEIGCVSL